MNLTQVVHMSKSAACLSSVQSNIIRLYYKVSVIVCPSEQHHCLSGTPLFSISCYTETTHFANLLASISWREVQGPLSTVLKSIKALDHNQSYYGVHLLFFTDCLHFEPEIHLPLTSFQENFFNKKLPLQSSALVISMLQSFAIIKICPLPAF